MKYIVHTRDSIRFIKPLVPFAIISVRTPNADRVAFATSTLCHGILELAFDDLDAIPRVLPFLVASGLEHPDDVTLFNEAAADAILDFWLQHDAIEELYLHCDAGWSRSPAIAAALQKVATNNDDFWFKTKQPNMLVYRTLLNRAFDRGLLDDGGN